MTNPSIVLGEVGRRIVIVAGAGASVALGEGRPMPLMTDWAASLRSSIDEVAAGLADVLGLKPGIPAHEFEVRLGRFLALLPAMDLVTEFEGLGVKPTTAEPPGVRSWAGGVRHTAAEINERIFADLYANFGHHRYNVGLAEMAYKSLLEALETRAKKGVGFGFATTNYDFCIDVAMRRLARNVLDGVNDPDGYDVQRLDPLGLASRALQSTSNVAVLHLHGAVGWYRQEDGGIIAVRPGMPYNPTLGVPAVLLPDPNKTPASFVGAEQLWIEFQLLLQSATHVLFVGHSLHDQHLVDVVADAGKPNGVSVHIEPALTGQDRVDAIRSAQERVHSGLPNATTIPADFGPHPMIDETSLLDWLLEGDRLIDGGA